MSSSNECRLCRSACNDSIRLHDANCKANEIYNITIKFFHPTFLDVDKGDANPLAVLCMTCWHHISIFNNFQQTVLLLQASLRKEAKAMKETNGPQKHQGSNDTIPTEFDDSDDIVDVKNIEFIDQVPENSGIGFVSGQPIDTDNSMTNTIAMGEDADFGLAEGESKVFSQDGDSHTDGDVPVVDECEDWDISDNSMDLLQMPGKAGTSDSRKKPERKKRNHRKSVQEIDAIIAKWKPALDCHVCSRTYTTFSEIQRHFQEDHPNDEFYILCCERKFKYRFRVEEHATLHLDPNAFKCTICDKVLKAKSYLKDHMMYVHPKNTTDSRCMCDICGIWIKIESLAKHRKLHDKNITHVCNHCSNTFKSRAALIQHMKYDHVGEKLQVRRSCQFCEKNFNDRQSLYRHIKRHHPEEFSKRKNTTIQDSQN